ncbi:hypothetical protein FJZ33_05270 [Candidatus Poribacteria bacterium]|nr:hypothetical protein [Candidatus Poribacteria bacterium]
MEQEKIKLTKKMLPPLMKPYVLLVLITLCIMGEGLWVYLAIKDRNYWEFSAMFIVGFSLGSVNGRWTAQLWDKNYLQSLLRRVKVSPRVLLRRKNAWFTYLALGIPLLLSFAFASHNPFLPSLQSYIFGFICGMNIMIYLWARKLPDQ